MVGSSPTSTTVASLQLEYALQFEDLPKNDLYRHVIDVNWDMAVFRSNNYQAEANRWVVKKDKLGEIEWRRLPIHQACICDPNTRIITSLLEAHPKGVYEVDNQERLPLHLACIHGANTYVIYLLLTAFPDAVNQKDKFGKCPEDYAQISEHENKEEIIKVLGKGPSGYEFGESDKVKVHEIKTEFEKRLIEVESVPAEKYGDNQQDPNDSIEVHLEEDGEDQDPMSGELLMSRSIIRGLEEQLEASLKSYDESKSQAKQFREKNLVLENKIKNLEMSKKEVESFIGFEDERNRDVITALEKEVKILSTRNTNMKFAFDRLEAAVLALERKNISKDATIKELRGKLEAIATLEKEMEMHSLEAMKKELQELKDEKQNLEDQINDNVTKQKEILETKVAVDKEAQLYKKGYDAECEKTKLLEEEIDSLNQEKINNLDKIRTAETYEEDIAALVDELKHTRSKVEILLGEKYRLHQSIKMHEKYQEDAERRMDSLEDNLCTMSDRNDELTKTIEALQNSFLRELNDEKQNLEDQISDNVTKQKEILETKVAVDKEAQLFKKGYDAECEKTKLLEEEIESLNQEKINNLDKIRTAGSYQDDIAALVDELKHTRSKNETALGEKYRLHQSIKTHERNQEDAERKMDSLEDNLCTMSDRNDELAKTIEALKSSLLQVMNDEKQNLEDQISDNVTKQKEISVTKVAVDKEAQLYKKGYDGACEKTKSLEEEIDSLNQEKINNLNKFRTVESYRDDISALVDELKHTRSKVEIVRGEKYRLHQSIKMHEKYQDEAERRMDSLEDNLCAMSDRNDELTKTIEALQNSLQGGNSHFHGLSRILNSASEFEYRDSAK